MYPMTDNGRNSVIMESLLTVTEERLHPQIETDLDALLRDLNNLECTSQISNNLNVSRAQIRTRRINLDSRGNIRKEPEKTQPNHTIAPTLTVVSIQHGIVVPPGMAEAFPVNTTILWVALITEAPKMQHTMHRNKVQCNQHLSSVRRLYHTARTTAETVGIVTHKVTVLHMVFVVVIATDLIILPVFVDPQVQISITRPNDGR